MASSSLLVLVPLALLLATASAELRKRPHAPLLAADAPTRIEGEYLVIFKKTATDEEVADHKQTVRKLMSYYNLAKNESYIMDTHQWSIGTFKGYGAMMTDRVRDLVRSMSIVDYVECNQVYTTQQAQCSNEQSAPSWGIVRTTCRDYDYRTNVDYSYNPYEDGSGVEVYIIDTGIDIQHPDFGGRALWGKDFVDTPSPETDENGHGTHVAGTVMADKYGLARGATAIAVRVLDQNGSGTTIGVVDGINYVADRHSPGKKSIANMSLGGGKSTALNNAVDAAVVKGVTMVVAAGNEARDACNVSPASAPLAVSVAASDEKDEFATFSNYGSQCVNLIAPGVDITSTWKNGGIKTISGTSMAAPHVAGVMAKYLSGGSYTPAQLRDKVVNDGTKNVVVDTKGAPDVLVFKSCFED